MSSNGSDSTPNLKYSAAEASLPHQHHLIAPRSVSIAVIGRHDVLHPCPHCGVDSSTPSLHIQLYTSVDSFSTPPRCCPLQFLRSRCRETVTGTHRGEFAHMRRRFCPKRLLPRFLLLRATVGISSTPFAPPTSHPSHHCTVTPQSSTVTTSHTIICRDKRNKGGRGVEDVYGIRK